MFCKKMYGIAAANLAADKFESEARRHIQESNYPSDMSMVQLVEGNNFQRTANLLRLEAAGQLRDPAMRKHLRDVIGQYKKNPVLPHWQLDCEQGRYFQDALPRKVES